MVVAVAATPGGARWWQQARLALGDDISDLVDEELAARPADAPDWTDMFEHLKLETRV